MILLVILLCVVLGGIVLTVYMASAQHSHRVIQCSIGGHCKEVYPIPYHRLCGIPLEILGSLYFSLMFVWFVVFGFIPSFITPFVNYLALSLSCIVFLYSFYLMLVQVWLMKYKCLPCLTSSLFCASIFLGVLLLTQGTMGIWLINAAEILSFLQTFGLSLGFGAALVGAVLLGRFLHDFRITAWEEDILHAVSQVRWIGFDLSLVTFIGLYLPVLDMNGYSPKHLLEWCIFIVIFLTTAVLHLQVLPVLTHLSLTKRYTKVAEHLRVERKAVFALTGIIVVSWFFLFVLGSVRETFFSLSSALILYVYVIAIVIVGSQLIEYFFTQKYEQDAKKVTSNP